MIINTEQKPKIIDWDKMKLPKRKSNRSQILDEMREHGEKIGWIKNKEETKEEKKEKSKKRKELIRKIPF